MISRTPCGLAAGMNGKSKDWKIWFRPFGRNKIGETPCALGTGIVNFKDFLYKVIIPQDSKIVNSPLLLLLVNAVSVRYSKNRKC